MGSEYSLRSVQQRADGSWASEVEGPGGAIIRETRRGPWTLQTLTEKMLKWCFDRNVQLEVDRRQVNLRPASKANYTPDIRKARQEFSKRRHAMLVGRGKSEE